MDIILRREPTRTLTALVPFYHPVALLDEIEELAREAWDSWQPIAVPHTELYEEKDEVVMKLALPGIQSKDVDITLEGNILTVKVEKERKEEAEDTKGYVRETYSSSVLLPSPVDGDKVSATLENGLLEIRLPKAEEAKPKKIEVRAQIPESKPKKRLRQPKPKSA